MQAYFTYNPNTGIPRALGVEFSSGLYEKTPMEASDGQNDVFALPNKEDVFWYCCGHEIKPIFPDSVKELTAFQHAVMNFNPKGHPPEEIYDEPHIDFHFYTQTEDERLDIPGVTFSKDMCDSSVPMSCQDKDDLAAPLPCDQDLEQLGYMNVDAVEPQMANHLIDFQSPEISAQEKFTYTFIYNTCYGNICGFEPMITNEFMIGLQNGRGKRKICINIKTPTKFPEAGYYPTKYCMEYKKKKDVFVVVLKEWELFEKSNGELCI